MTTCADLTVHVYTILYHSDNLIYYNTPLDKSERVIRNGQSRDTENIENKTLNEVKQNDKTQHKILNSWETLIPPKLQGLAQVTATSKQFLFLIRHLLYY